MTERYFDFPLTDGSRICVLRYERMAQVNHMLPDGTVPSHNHDFFEMVLILRGSCQHIYEDASSMLLPGDLFMIPPHRPHAYRFHEDVDHFNCQFYTDALPVEWLETVQSLRYDRLQRAYTQGVTPARGLADLNRQGILHMDNPETRALQHILAEILSEQQSARRDAERMKRCLLQLLLARLSRVCEQQFAGSDHQDRWKREMVEDALNRFEGNIAAEVDIAGLAARYHVSEGYFRHIFKDITGLPPRQYLNRMRVVRAVELLNGQGLDIPETAERVGIYDTNYFSRLCKKLTGYPPSHFLRRRVARLSHREIPSLPVEYKK